jgi:hypothetical protein
MPEYRDETKMEVEGHIEECRNQIEDMRDVVA